MTKDEKLLIYNFLKTTSDSLYGFSSPHFPKDTPQFLDDVPAQFTENAAQNPQENFSPAYSSTPESTRPQNAGASDTISNIALKIAQCQRCPLAKMRMNTVPGEGIKNPFVLVIGEGPGEEEDRSGRPFVGPAGQLLDKMLAAIGLSRTTNTFIANIVKCRPPYNRNPEPNEADSCRSFLDAQIAALKPKAILAAGSVAIKNLLHTNEGVLRLHGKILDYNGIPLCTTYHPSALLRAPENKRVAWEDLKIFRTKLLELNPDYQNQK
ncbi:uracil-DNA glycosylase [Treponema zioleckii]|uniref:uracil-DNA glycosylase n=1 Tax=Treponema zioleckii TaxID=331680 RepID=UPI00168B4E15|nr:uracil-DNA glycosylase [Treponema zioleckii]